MDPLILFERPHVGIAAALTAIGVWLVAGARPAWKRAVGVAIAHMGPMALIAVGAPGMAELAAVISLMALSYVILGWVLAVRLQEDLRTIETDELDALDDADPKAPGASG
jgi:hydrogenase-4 membrane subunit HyfE